VQYEGEGVEAHGGATICQLMFELHCATYLLIDPRLGDIRGGDNKMVNHPNRARFYAAQSPRGFANEVNIYIFSTRSSRDAWVQEHAEDGDVNAASQGAYKVTKREALRPGGEEWNAFGPQKGVVRGTFVC
jgi:hypothetical protein